MKGFTLIELLVVIAIIGVLSSVVLVSLDQARTRARHAAAASELEQIYTAIEAARFSTGKLLTEITGSTWSDQDCRGFDLTTIADNYSHDCYLDMYSAFVKVNDASGGMLDNFVGTSIEDSNLLDPWGSIYVWDENEVTNVCRTDKLRSAGPDRINRGGSDQDALTIEIPLTGSNCSN